MTSRFLFIVALALGLVPGLQAQEERVDLGGEVRAVFLHRCSECHGADLRKPKGKFGYVADLVRVREDFVASNEAEDTDLWLSLTDEFEPMPPKKAKNGLMSAEELDLVRRWLIAGAPAPRAEASTLKTEKTGAEAQVADSGGDDEADSTGLAAIHPLVIHFPIALILVAALAEALIIFTGSRQENTVRLCLLIGVGGALLAGISGWAAAEAEGYRDATVFAHRWLGVSTLGSATLAFLLIELGRRRGSSLLLWLGRLALLAAALLTSLAGHEGGELIHGPSPFF